jgi:hypothetical protein
LVIRHGNTLPKSSHGRLATSPLRADNSPRYGNFASGSLAKISPQLKPLGDTLIQIAAGAGIGAIKFFTANAKRRGIESGFCDTKDLRSGTGMASISVNAPQRRNWLWLLNASAVVLPTLLEAPGEALGYDRHLKSNTSKRRTHSLFPQGAMLYDLMPMI